MSFHYFYKTVFERTAEVEKRYCQDFTQEVLERRGVMVWLTHRSQQGFPMNKEQKGSIRNAVLALQTLSQTSRVLSFPLLWHLEAREKKGW